jgi:hypothetical protein
MLPTNYFKDPDVMSLSNGDVRLILIGLVLTADDYGRGLAHTQILGRELDYTPQQIEDALVELEQGDLVQCYQVGKHRFYALRRWEEWQTLSKRSPSKYPVPPSSDHAVSHDHQYIPEDAEKISENSGKSLQSIETNGITEKIFTEGEGEGEQEQEGEEKQSEGKGDSPPKIVTFPTTHIGANAAFTNSPVRILEVTQQVATILNLTVTDALTRTVTEYLDDPSVSLLGEADAAREWVDDPLRNRRGQRLTPAFFRRWLQREREAYEIRRGSIESGQQRATGTLGGGTRLKTTKMPMAAGRSPMHPPQSEDPYQAFVAQRSQQILARPHPQGGGQP